MYLRCPECKSRYEISASRIPDGGARVRCPRCRTVFHVSRPLNGNGGNGAPVARPVAGAPPDPETSRRIARSLIHDLVTRHRERIDAARGEDKLLSTLGPEILEAWSAWRSHVGDGPGDDPILFREVVNDLIGGGERIL